MNYFEHGLVKCNEKALMEFGESKIGSGFGVVHLMLTLI
jgi:hypothetical protein